MMRNKDFKFSVIGMQHPHIYGMCSELINAGAVLVSAYDKEKKARDEFAKKFPDAEIARCEDEILCNEKIKLVAGAAITCERGELGVRVMEHGKDYFTDKGPFTTLSQLEKARQTAARTGAKYMVCYSERLQSDCAEMANMMIKRGDIGKVLQVVGMGPHRLNASSRPDWFWKKKKYGGIIADICSHQFEQFLCFSGEEDAAVTMARTANFAHPEHPEFEDFGEASLVGKNGTAGYVKVDWFTPDGLSTWGDGRTFIMGTDGCIELRKYTDLSGREGGNHLFITTNKEKTCYVDAEGFGHPFFASFIDDCINRTENAMTQEHAFTSARLCLEAQKIADRNAKKYAAKN